MDNDSKLRQSVRQAYAAYLRLSPKQRADYRVPAKLCSGDIVPANYFRRRLGSSVLFAQDSRGAKQSLIETIASLISTGVFECVPEHEAFVRYGSQLALYRAGITNELRSNT